MVLAWADVDEGHGLAYVVYGLLGGVSYGVVLWTLNQLTGCFRPELLLEMVASVPGSRALLLGGLLILAALAGASCHCSSLSKPDCCLLAAGAALSLTLMLYDPLHFLFSLAAALGISFFQDTWARSAADSTHVSTPARFLFFLASAVVWGGNVWLATHLCFRYILPNFLALLLCCMISPSLVSLRCNKRCGSATQLLLPHPSV